MTEYLKEKFSVRLAGDETYRDNFDRTFGKKDHDAAVNSYVQPEDNGYTKYANDRMHPHFEYARAVARKANPERADKMSDEELNNDPFVTWLACLFGDFVVKHGDEPQPPFIQE